MTLLCTSIETFGAYMHHFLCSRVINFIILDSYVGALKNWASILLKEKPKTRTTWHYPRTNSEQKKSMALQSNLLNYTWTAYRTFLFSLDLQQNIYKIMSPHVVFHQFTLCYMPNRCWHGHLLYRNWTRSFPPATILTYYPAQLCGVSC